MMRSRKKGIMANKSTKFIGPIKKANFLGAQVNRIYKKNEKYIGTSISRLQPHLMYNEILVWQYSSDVDTITFFWIIEAIMSDALCLRTHVVFIYFLLTVILLVKNCKENEWIKKLTTYSITKNPTRILSIIFIAYTASGYSGGAFLSSSDWNSGNVPNTKVNVDIRTTPRDVKAMIWNRNKKIYYYYFSCSCCDAVTIS